VISITTAYSVQPRPLERNKLIEIYLCSNQGWENVEICEKVKILHAAGPPKSVVETPVYPYS